MPAVVRLLDQGRHRVGVVGSDEQRVDLLLDVADGRCRPARRRRRVVGPWYSQSTFPSVARRLLATGVHGLEVRDALQLRDEGDLDVLRRLGRRHRRRPSCSPAAPTIRRLLCDASSRCPRSWSPPERSCTPATPPRAAVTAGAAADGRSSSRSSWYGRCARGRSQDVRCQCVEPPGTCQGACSPSAATRVCAGTTSNSGRQVALPWDGEPGHPSGHRSRARSVVEPGEPPVASACAGQRAPGSNGRRAVAGRRPAECRLATTSRICAGPSNSPSAASWTAPLPSALASTGPQWTTRPVASAVNWDSRVWFGTAPDDRHRRRGGRPVTSAMSSTTAR